MNAEDVVNLTDKEALEVLHSLRWPKTNGEPVCPYGHKSCSCKFDYKTNQAFEFSKLKDKQFLGLIYATRDFWSYARTGQEFNIKPETAKKWILTIREEFGHDEVLFPAPSRKHHDVRQPKERPVVIKKEVSKRQVAKYILKHNKAVTIKQFENDFIKYKSPHAVSVLNSLINKPKDQLRLIKNGGDPTKKYLDEIASIEKTIAAQDREILDNMGKIKDDDENEDLNYDYSSFVDGMCRG